MRSRVDVIVIIGPAPLEAARKATNTIPPVMSASSIDPVAEGVALSLARPGGNITGLTYAVSSDRFGKQLELLKSAAGRIARVAVLWDFDLETFRRFWAAPLTEASRILGLTIQEPVRVRTAQDLPAAFISMKQQRADAMLVATGGSAIFPSRAQVGELALHHRLPAIAALKEITQAGLRDRKRARRRSRARNAGAACSAGAGRAGAEADGCKDFQRGADGAQGLTDHAGFLITQSRLPDRYTSRPGSLAN